jgi:hypothetical protein
MNTTRYERYAQVEARTPQIGRTCRSMLKGIELTFLPSGRLSDIIPDICQRSQKIDIRDKN